MNTYLDQLILEFPNPNTLGWLIHDGFLKFENRIWLNTKSRAIDYKTADILSLQIASFLKENDYHHKNYLFIDTTDGIEAGVVLLGAIKAGVTLVDAKIHPPLTRQSFMENKRLLLFENNKFTEGANVIDYSNAIKQGEKALFYNIPDTCETDNAFNFFTNDENGHLQSYPVDHKKAVKQIYSSINGNNLHPYTRVVYNWFNGFAAPGC